MTERSLWLTDAIECRRSGSPRAWIPCIALAVLCAAGGVARAQLPQHKPADAGAADKVPEEEEEVAQDSPRASLAQFLELARQGRYAEAAGYLELPRARRADGAELAWRLKAVLDRHVWFDLERISPLPGGLTTDGLPRATDEIARIPGAAGTPTPVRLVRRRVEGSVRWLFSRATVNRIDAWYDALENKWVLENLPEPLLRTGPRGLLYWQWLALPVLLIVAWLSGFLLNRLTRRIFSRLAARTSTRWDDEFLARIGYPLTGAWGLGIAYALLPSLALYEPAEDFVHRLLRAGFFVIFFWGLARALDVGRVVISASPWAQTHGTARSLLPLASRVGKVLLGAIAVVALLSELGYPVASLVAGLGIGGLAVALAAQKSLENLFGAFSIGADQPFREGDFVRIDDFVGTVEIIGLRSTKFRTLDRTLITIPNGKLSDMRLETFAVRDRMRLACFVRLKYGTTSDQVRDVLDGLERVLRAHPKIWPDSMTVRLNSFGESSLDIEVMAWFQTWDWDEFMLIRQDVLLSFMEVVEKAGAALAVPTRTIHMVADKIGEKSAEKNA